MAEETRDELLELLKRCNPRTRKTVMRVNKTDLLLDGPYWQSLKFTWVRMADLSEVLGIPPIELAIAQVRHPSINSNFWKV